MIPKDIAHIIALGLSGILITLKKTFLDEKIKSKALSRILSFVAFTAPWTIVFYVNLHGELHNIARSIYRNDTKQVERLLNAGENIDKRDKNNGTFLHIAMGAKNSTEIIKLLISRGSNVNARMKGKVTPLHIAAGNNKTKYAEILLKKGANIDSVSDDKVTPLHAAVISNNPQMVQLLLSHGANPNLPAYDGSTSLHYSAYSFLAKEKFMSKNNASTKSTSYSKKDGANNNKIVELLLTHKANISIRNEQKATPLHIASLGDDIQNINLLLNHGADINAPGPEQSSPLNLAVSNGKIEIVRLLLSRGAKVNQQSINSLTPLHHAVGKSDQKKVTLLLEYGADLEIKDGSKATPLISAVYKNDIPVAKILLKYNARTDVRVPIPMSAVMKADRQKLTDRHKSTIDSGASILHISILKKFKDMTTLLLDNGADINVLSVGFTPLMYAVMAKSPDLVKLLLKYKAKRLAKSVDGNIAIDIARELKLQEIVAILEA